MIDFSRCPIAPWDHQRVGVERLLAQPRVALFDEVGMGKSLQVVAPMCALAEIGLLDTLLVVCPAYARSVWASDDPLLGEVVKHRWANIPITLHEFSAKSPRLPERPKQGLQVVATNYELVRREPRLASLKGWLRGRRTWLVVDESWMVNNPNAQQTKAVGQLADVCERVTLLNGTPGAPEQVYSQISILNPRAYPVKNWPHWKARYTKLGGFQGKVIVGYREDTTPERIRIEAPYILRRLAADCLDLPEQLPPLTLEARLTPATWAVYTHMRDDFVAWLDSATLAIATQAGVKAMRLQQILAGFVGGVEQEDLDLLAPPTTRERVIGREKIDAILTWLDSGARIKTLIWCQFRSEMARLAEELRARNHRVFMLWGQQLPTEREIVKKVFAPGSPDAEPAVLVGHPGAGGAGLNFAGADVAIYATNGYSLIKRQQSKGRVLRPGQRSRVRFVDIVAVGPTGQKTLDHGVLAALRNDEDISTWTAQQWKHAIS